MNKFRSTWQSVIRAVLVATLLLTGPTTAALAADVINTTSDNYSPNVHYYCVTNATAGYTNATTSATDITGASCTIPAVSGDYAKSFIHACWWSDATKGTATTGSIGVYVNGALVTASKRFIASAAGQGTVNGCYTVARADGNSQTVKLQGVSGDTNTFTVAQLVFEVSTFRTLK